MASLADLFKFKSSMGVPTEIPNIYPLGFEENKFIEIDIETIYTKILTDVVERVNGIPDDKLTLLWDNCLASESPDGLITMLAKAMSQKSELFLVFDTAGKIIRKATGEETIKIREDYKAKAESSTGLFTSFKNYHRSDMVKLWSRLGYYTIDSLNKSMSLSKAIQLRMGGMRSNTAASDSADVIAQASTIAKALKEGKDVVLDGTDEIVTAQPNLSATKESIAFLDAKSSFYLGLPASYITGIQSGGIGATGEGDTKAIERGLKVYFFSIVKPVLENLLGIKLSYKSQDFRQITQGLEALKTFQLVDDNLLGASAKKKIVEGLFDVSESENEVDETPTPTPPPRDVTGSVAP